jgi:hypothetical protein
MPREEPLGPIDLAYFVQFLVREVVDLVELALALAHVVVALCEARREATAPSRSSRQT